MNNLLKVISIIVVAIMLTGCATTKKIQTVKNPKNPTLLDGFKLLDTKEYKKANKVFEKYCKEDNAHACAMLSYSYSDALGVDLNEQKAIEFMTKSCKLGDSSSCEEIQDIKEEFKFMELNKLFDANKIDEGISLMDESCVKDKMSVMCKELVKYYTDTIGIKISNNFKKATIYIKDIDKVIYYKMTDCNNGNGEACYDLANEYSKTSKLKLEPDIAKSLALYEKGCKSGHQDSCDVYEIMNESSIVLVFMDGTSLENKEKQLKQLLALGHDIDAITNNDLNPLLFTIIDNKIEDVKLLLKYGASSSVKLFGKTISELTIKNKKIKKEIRELLK